MTDGASLDTSPPEETPEGISAGSSTARTEVIRLALLGAFQWNRKASWVEEVKARAEVVFPARASLRARQWLAKRLDTVDGACPLELRLVGYSWGGWTAMQLTERLLRQPGYFGRAWKGRDLQVRLGLLDPVDTWRRGVRLPDDPRLKAWNVYQRNGCFRNCPGPGIWYAGHPVANAINWDVTDEGRDRPVEGGVPAACAPDHLQLGYRAWGQHGVRIAGVLDGRAPQAPAHAPQT